MVAALLLTVGFLGLASGAQSLAASDVGVLKDSDESSFRDAVTAFRSRLAFLAQAPDATMSNTTMSNTTASNTTMSGTTMSGTTPSGGVMMGSMGALVTAVAGSDVQPDGSFLATGRYGVLSMFPTGDWMYLISPTSAVVRAFRHRPGLLFDLWIVTTDDMGPLGPERVLKVNLWEAP